MLSKREMFSYYSQCCEKLTRKKNYFYPFYICNTKWLQIHMQNVVQDKENVRKHSF